MYQGAILGFALSFCGLLFHFFNIITCEVPILYTLMNTIIMILFLIYALRIYKFNYSGGFFDFFLCVKVGISISVFSAFLFGLWKVLLVYYVNPEFSSLCVDYAQQKLLEIDEQSLLVLEKWGFNVDAELDRLEDNRAPARSHMIFFREIVNKALIGFIFSSFIYLFIRNRSSNINSIN